MATSGNVPAAGGNGVDAVASLLQLFGGTKSSSRSTADTSQLRELWDQLNGEGGQKMLEALFSQAGTQIPGFRNAFQNAAGLRSGSNSGMEVALQKLLQNTVLRAQDQLTTQRTNIAKGITEGTKGQEMRQGTDLWRGLLGLGGMQLAGKAYKAIDGWGNAVPDAATAASSVAAPALEPLTTLMPTQSFDFGVDPTAGIASGMESFISEVGPSIGGIGTSISDWADELFSTWGFAEGGLVGRDGEKTQRVNIPGMRASSTPTFDLADIIRSMATNSQPAAVSQNPMELSGQEVGTPGVQPYGPGNPAPQSQAPTARGILGAVMNAALLATNPPMGFANLLDQALTEHRGVPTSAVKDLTLTAVNPQAAAIKGIIGLLSGAYNAARKGQMDNQTDAVDLGLGIGGQFNGVATIGPSIDAGFNAAEALGQGIDSIGSDSAGFGFGTDTSSGDYGGGNGSESENAGPGGDNANAAGELKNGGQVKGPGTGTSDSIPAMVSNGEFIIPAHVVKAKGTEFFDKLLEQYAPENQNKGKK